MEIWNRHFECMDRDELRKVQSERLLETVERVYFNVPYYRHKMQEAGLGPESIHSIDDLIKLPYTTKQDLRDNYPFGLFAVPMSEIVRIHASSGTTGKATVVGYTRNDISTWSEVMARTLICAGANRNDFIQIAYGYGLFTPEGTTGELVFTTLTKEGLPLIRYRTRDLTRLTTEKCKCGRTMVRMDKCLGRSDDMLIIRGVNLFPSQVESVLLEMSEIKPHYLLIVDRVNNLDTLELKVEVDEAFFLDKISQLESLQMKIQENLESSLGLGIKVTLVEPKMIERSDGKSTRVIDKRKF